MRTPAQWGSQAVAWLSVLGVAALLGLLAMLANVTSTEQISGQADAVAAVRKTVSRLANAGTVWAGVSVVAGWLVARPWSALLAGAAAPLTALVVHYGLTDLFGLMAWTGWVENRGWFVAALALGPPLGLVGLLARRSDIWGILSRLVLPLGAVSEPFFSGWIPPMPMDTWPNRVSGIGAGSLLIAGGCLLAALVLARRPSKQNEGFPAVGRT